MGIPGLAELEAAKAVLLSALTAGIGQDEVLPALEQLESFRNSLCQADHLLIQAADQYGLAERECVSSIEKLVARTLRISYPEAKRRVLAAAAVGPRQSLGGEPLAPNRVRVAEAQAVGELSPVAVDLITRTLAKVELIAPSRTDSTEEVLVGYAKQFDPTELARVCDRVLDHVDPDGTKPRDLVQRERRALHLGRCRDGMTRVDGRLTAAAAARIRAVLEPLAAPRSTTEPGPQGGIRVVPDDRPREQRLHDALDEACARLLRAGDVPDSGGVPATVILTMTEEQLAATRDATRTSTPSATRDQPPVVTAETATGEVLSIAEALRLAAEAQVISVVMSATGQPLHLGRTRRLASSAQTWALFARDGGCSFPGCTIPPQWCERHHIVAWHLGGTTDIDNLTLLCGYHHGHFVQAGWTCTLNGDGLPAWRPPRWLRSGAPPLVNHRILERHRVPVAEVSGPDPPIVRIREPVGV